MVEFGPIVAGGVAAAAVGLVILFFWVSTRRRIAAETVDRAQAEAERLLADARREAEAQHKEALFSAREQAHELRQKAEADDQARRAELATLERELASRRRGLDDRDAALARATEAIETRETAMAATDRALAKREAAAETDEARRRELVAEAQRALQQVAGMTADEAKASLLHQLETDARHDAAHLVKRLEHEARETAEAKAKQIITQAIQRSAPDHAIEATVSVVDLPSDDLKGRIIGREGRNIRALETATGVELIVDDTPGAIILSCFDPFRREIARQSIEQLVADGRIHPARIEEVVEKVRTEMDAATLKDGESAAFELGMHDLHPELSRMMGRLKYRTSYGQNVLAHSKEVAYVAGVMAREVGLDAKTTIRAAFLHDIGKAMDRELDGTHLQLGIDFLRKHGETKAVIDAMAAHHMDIDWPSLESMIVQAADAISAARPGARRDILESYVKRIEKLEGIADSFQGVSKAFALQAGREIRIMVQSEQISDEDAVWLSRDIAKRIENELQYPGQIKVTVIRETRSVEYAK